MRNSSCEADAEWTARHGGRDGEGETGGDVLGRRRRRAASMAVINVCTWRNYLTRPDGEANHGLGAHKSTRSDGGSRMNSSSSSSGQPSAAPGSDIAVSKKSLHRASSRRPQLLWQVQC